MKDEKHAIQPDINQKQQDLQQAAADQKDKQELEAEQLNQIAGGLKNWFAWL